MDIRKLQRAIVDGLEDVKAQHIVVFNTEHLSPLFERVIIATGSSNRQTKALASSVRDAVKTAGLPVLSTEGGDNGEWIIVDCGAAVAHIMQPTIRDYYRLEEIWGGKPVKMKIGDGAAKGLVKASADPEPAAGAAPRARASAAVARKASTPSVAGRSPAQRAPAARSAAGKTVEKMSGKVAGKGSTALGSKPLSARQAGLAKPTKPAHKSTGKAAPAKRPAGPGARPTTTAPARRAAGTAAKRASGTAAKAVTKALTKTATKAAPRTASRTASKAAGGKTRSRG